MDQRRGHDRAKTAGVTGIRRADKELDREPKAQNRKLPAFAAFFPAKNSDFPDSLIRADLAYFCLSCGKSECIEKTSDWQPNFTVKCCLCSAVRNHCPDIP